MLIDIARNPHFRKEHGLLPIAICSRTVDFEALGKQLAVRNAVAIQALDRDQIERYLGGSTELNPLVAAVSEDPSLFELVETPLMLWVTMMAYRHAPVRINGVSSLEQRRALLFASFVNAMFKRRAPPKRGSQSITVRQLSWLANSLTRNQQTVFFLEDLDFGSFQSSRQRVSARVAVGASSTIIAGFLFLFSVEIVLGGLTGYGLGLREATVSWLTIGIFFGLISTFVKLRPKERVRFSSHQLRNRLISCLPSALLV